MEYFNETKSTERHKKKRRTAASPLPYPAADDRRHEPCKPHDNPM